MQGFGSFKPQTLRERNPTGIIIRNVKFKAGWKQNSTIDTSQCFDEDFKPSFLYF